MIRSVANVVTTSALGERLAKGKLSRSIQGALPPRLKIALQFSYHLGYVPNLRQPMTLNEKIQYRKLYDRDPRLAPLIDKIAVKDVVADVLGSDWIIPTLWSGTDPALIPFDTLIPPYVVKANHTSNCNLFVLDVETLDPGSIRAQAAPWLRIDHARYAHEWAYSMVTPAILIEPFIGDTTSLPIDLKFYVFHGRVHYIEVCVERGTVNKRFVYFDRDWIWQPVSEHVEVAPPRNLTAMIEAAETLAAPFGFARVDFYEVDERPLFGEITFYPSAGYDVDHSLDFDRALGALWQLSPS